MLPLFNEYDFRHHRFHEHLRIAVVMALVAPGCAFLFFRMLAWWNPWLWGACGAGVALALALISMVYLLKTEEGLSPLGQRLARNAEVWFPYFFVGIQSAIASLILMFLWFSMTSMVLEPPPYLHGALVLLALMIPVRRLLWAHVKTVERHALDNWNDVTRCIWHLLATVFITGSIIRLTISDLSDTSPENIAWQIMLWVPATLYMLFTLLTTLDHIFHLSAKIHRHEDAPPKEDDTVDRF